MGRIQVITIILSTLAIIGCNILSFNMGKKVLEAQIARSASKAEIQLLNVEKRILEDSHIMNIELQNKINKHSSEVYKMLKDDFYNNVCIKEDMKNQINKKVKNANSN